MFLINSSSLAAVLIIIYSLSVEFCTIIDCSLDFYIIGPPARTNKYPVVLLAVAKSPV
jgi:hypothetical protein